jgi:hypothetical protein
MAPRRDTPPAGNLTRAAARCAASPSYEQAHQAGGTYTDDSRGGDQPVGRKPYQSADSEPPRELHMVYNPPPRRRAQLGLIRPGAAALDHPGPSARPTASPSAPTSASLSRDQTRAGLKGQGVCTSITQRLLATNAVPHAPPQTAAPKEDHPDGLT